MLLVHQMDHLLSADCESSAGGNGRGRCQTGPSNRRKRLFSHKVTGGKKRNSCFLPARRSNRDCCTPRLEVSQQQLRL